jgi:hypothetical protein
MSAALSKLQSIDPVLRFAPTANTTVSREQNRIVACIAPTAF